jgi:hypothetical protein
LNVSKIILHCSDSDFWHHDDIKVIDDWHRKRGWDGVGYQLFVKKTGEIQLGRPLNKVGAHTKGHNKNSIGVCMSGKNDFPQLTHTISLLLYLLKSFSLTPDDLFGHYEIDSNKTCPNIDMNYIRNVINKRWLK